MNQIRSSDSPFQPPESPFQKQEQVRLSFSLLVVLLLMVVGAGTALLLYSAMKVPAITNEFNSWLGRTGQEVDLKEARRAQLIFAMYLYSAPLALGMLVFSLHRFVNFLDRRSRKATPEDDAFRMDWSDETGTEN